MTWWALTYAASKAAHLPHQRVFLCSRRMGEDRTQGARELLARSGFILGNVRGDAIPFTQGEFLLQLPNGSTVSPVSSDPQAFHGLATTLILLDEFAYYDEPLRTLAAALPTGEREGEIVGQVLAITTTECGPFEEILFDGHRADEVVLDEDGVPKWALDVTRYDGFEPAWLQAWTNPRNGFRVIDMNLEADEQTRTPEQLAALQAGVLPHIWETQYRKRFLARGGKAIYGQNFVSQLMVRDELQPIATEPLLIGLDFGKVRPAAVVAQLVAGPQLRIYRTLIGHQTTTRLFIHHLLAKLEQWFPGWKGGREWCCDHSGNRVHSGEDQDQKAFLRTEFQIHARSQYALVPPTLDRVRDFMALLVASPTAAGQIDPGFLVAKHPDTMFLRRGLTGEYRYAEPTPQNPNPIEPARNNAWRDVMDALRYIVMNFGGAKAMNPEQRALLLAVSRKSVRQPRRYVI